ncbi:MAG TPA: hypothetical protein DDW22_00025, partial [Prevotellaceae bacterium]|nr:hypothetical protein [Prevotellaceae bacterium]
MITHSFPLDTCERRVCSELALLTRVESGRLMASPHSVRFLVLHCSATRCDRDYTVLQMERDHKERGFTGIGYHFYVRRDGTLTQHRLLLEVGAHARPYNHCSIGICYEGGLDGHGKPRDTRTTAQTRRLDTLLVDFLGAEDRTLTRMQTRKQFTAAVARIYKPGTKYDYALVLTGPEGIGKSTLLSRMGGEWFSDSVATIEGKEGMENLRKAWLIELGELAGIKRSEVEAIKQFLSRSEDRYRPAYGKRLETFRRQCVFFGTTN